MHECTCGAFWLLYLEIVFYFSSLILNSFIALSGSQQLSTARVVFGKSKILARCTDYDRNLTRFFGSHGLLDDIYSLIEYTMSRDKNRSFSPFCSYNSSDSVKAQCAPSYFRWEAPSWLELLFTFNCYLVHAATSSLGWKICSIFFSSQVT